MEGHGGAGDSSTISRIFVVFQAESLAPAGYWNGMSERHVSNHSAALLLLPSFCGDFPTVPPARVGHRPGSTVILAHRTPTAVVDRGWRDSRQCLDIREVTQSNWRRFGEIRTKGLTLSTPRAPKRRTHNAKPQNPSSATRCCALRTMLLWYRT